MYQQFVLLRPQDEQMPQEIRRKYFSRCHYKGSSTTVTNPSSYTPSDEEKYLMKQQGNYIDAVMPNAIALNDYAMGLLKDSLGTVQVDYNKMNQNAQNQISNATSGLSGLVGSNNAATSSANNTLGSLINQNNNLANSTANQYGSLADSYANAANKTNSTLGNLMNQNSSLADSTASQYGNLAGNYTNAANQANSTLGSLASGTLPSAYQQNMENSISSAVNNTVGKAINNLGNRGILNSSVTSSALNDIEKNASDTVASQYQNNINQVANLTQQQNQNTNNATNSLGNLIGQQYDVKNNALGQAGTLAQQQNQNTNNAANSIGNLIGQQYDVRNNALGQAGSLTQQQLSNTQGNNSANQGIYGSLIDAATSPITSAATAQEAAQTPAMNLWQTSLGLNSANTGALAAAAGKGTTTSSQTQRTSGGSFFGNLLGSAIGGWASCFPEGTKVTLADGTERDIKHVHEGDEVLTADGTPAKVIQTMPPVYSDVYCVIAEHGHTSTTLTQSFMKPDGEYVLLKDLTIGTELKNVGKVQSVVYSGERKVYDLQVDGDNNYIADGFVANGGSSEIWGNG